MQAQIESRPLRPSWITFLGAILTALLLGVSFGYTLRPVTVASPGPNPGAAAEANPSADSCVWFGQHKGC
jgi:hypothetical protein